jgi:aspartyl-tRNA(Asn)/glutamyl-tRNA(Gln) amidotransferase subunit A
MERSALQTGALIQAGALDPEKAALDCLAAIEACDDQSIFTLLTADRAKIEARASALRLRNGRSRGILDGVPVSFKDLFDLEGCITTAGSRMLDGEPAAIADAAVVGRLKVAGMVTIGRTNMSEFAFSGLGLNPHFGTPRNPHGGGEARAPGGSSSGSGVAVARGFTPVSIGTDTGGSIRVPASFNGVVGLKTSSGRYPMDGCFPLARSLDTIGVLCRSVADAVAVDAALRGFLAPEPMVQPLSGIELIVPDTVMLDACEPAVLRNFEASLAALAEAGVVVSRRAFPVFAAILDLFGRLAPLVSVEAYSVHRARLAGTHTIDRRVVSRILRGADLNAADYIELLETRARMIASLAPVLGPRCFIACPSTPHVAPPIAPLEADDAHFHAVNLKTLRNTMIGNFLDWCGVSLPNGSGEAGMPTGLLLNGGPGFDSALLGFALSAEAILSTE